MIITRAGEVIILVTRKVVKLFKPGVWVKIR